MPPGGVRRHVTADAPRLVFEPPAGQWAARLLDYARARQSPDAAEFRRELGLAIDRPIVMSGHQPTIWHAGILAKALAAEAVADAARADSVWLVADQDPEHAAELRHPYLGADAVWSSATIHLRGDIGSLPHDIAACSLPAQRPPDSSPRLPDGTLESVRAGVARVLQALTRHADAPDAAHQAALAARDLLTDLMRPPRMIFASALASTSLFRSMVDQMAREPDRVVLAYNRAVAQRPHAGIAPLKLDDLQDVYELPLWGIEPGQARRRIYAHDMGEVDPRSLAPRALLMTGILRWAACDLFVHGIGGGQYDPITEQWLGEWLGARLAPAVVASADVRLPIQTRTAGIHELARAQWRLHRARHDPGMLGEPNAAEQKNALVERIASRRAAGEHPLDDYRALHRLLDEVRSRRADELEGFAREVGRAERDLASAAVAQDRSWPFPFHDPEILAALRRAIRRAFGVEALAHTPASAIP